MGAQSRPRLGPHDARRAQEFVSAFLLPFAQQTGTGKTRGAVRDDEREQNFGRRGRLGLHRRPSTVGRRHL